MRLEGLEIFGGVRHVVMHERAQGYLLIVLRMAKKGDSMRTSV